MIPTPSTRTYFLVQARMREVISTAAPFPGTVVKDDTLAYLGSGDPTFGDGVLWQTSLTYARHFRSREEARAAYAVSRGSPWMFLPKDNTATIITVTEIILWQAEPL